MGESPHHTTSRAVAALDASHIATQSSTTALFKIRHSSISVIPVFQNPMQEDHCQTEAILDYIVFFKGNLDFRMRALPKQATKQANPPLPALELGLTQGSTPGAGVLWLVDG